MSWQQLRVPLCHQAGSAEGGAAAQDEWIAFASTRRHVGFLHAPTPGSVSPALFHGEGQVPRNKCKESNSSTFEAECTPKQQDATTQNSDCQHSAAYQYAAVKHQKKGILDQRDEGKSSTYQYSDDSTCKSEQSICRFPACCRIEEPRSQKVQHSRLGVSRWSTDFPLPSKTDAVSPPRKTHATVQTGLGRGPHYPTFTRIEAGSFTQKAHIRRAAHPFSAAESPQQYRRCCWVPPTSMERHYTHR